jgi:predicted SAM-dependent methyltransferase
MTTGSNAANGIDSFVSDAVATPVESLTQQFTEKLLLLPTHYIVNDHVQMLGHTLEGPRPRLPGVRDHTFVFATFSNWQKMDPSVFSAWMAILARVPSSVLWFLRYAGHDDAEGNLKREADAHGIDGAARLVFSPLAPWVNHTHGKRAADLVLDTTLKNGHTTLLDALFAGVPVLTLEGNRMSNRAGTSALRALDLQHALTVNSLKEYVDVAVFLATHPQVMSKLRAQVEARRLVYPLLDTSKYTRNFVDALQSAWAVTKAANNGFSHAQQRRTFHVFPARQLTQLDPHPLHVQSALNDPHTGDEYAAKVQAALATSAPVLLHIGGSVAKPGWWVVDVNDGTHVDFQLRMANLYAFPDDSVTAIYASHVLEHNHFQLHDEVTRTLHEWWRVLKPGGALFVSVPDLHVLASLFVRADMSPQDQYLVMKVMFGGQIDAYDVHNVGFFEPLLVAFLENAGFCEIERVANFGLFNDTSAMAFHGTPISLNVQARTCDKKDGAQHVHVKLTTV